MSTGNINLDILLGQIETDRIAGTDTSISAIMKRYPSLSWKQAEEIYKMVSAACMVNPSVDASLVATVPPSFSVKAKSTKNTVESMVRGAKRNILITGYSLSVQKSDAERHLHGVLATLSRCKATSQGNSSIMVTRTIYVRLIIIHGGKNGKLQRNSLPIVTEPEPAANP